MLSKEQIIETSKYSDENLITKLTGFSSHITSVRDIKLHYVTGGKGEPLVLIAGWPQTWWSFHKIMPTLSKKYKVIAVDIRGMGSSDKPLSGYSKKNIALDILELINHLGLDKVNIAGHDIGANVAISFAGHHPAHTKKLIILDTPHPDENMYKLPMLPFGAPVHPWWVAFNQIDTLPEELLYGRFNIVQEWIFNKLLVNKSAITDFDREIYANAYNNKDAIRASNGWYKAFQEDIADIKTMKSIKIPTLGIASPAGYQLLKLSLPAYITNFDLKMIENSGHFIQEEKPEKTVRAIIDFLEAK